MIFGTLFRRLVASFRKPSLPEPDSAPLAWVFGLQAAESLSNGHWWGWIALALCLSCIWDLA